MTTSSCSICTREFRLGAISFTSADVSEKPRGCSSFVTRLPSRIFRRVKPDGHALPRDLRCTNYRLLIRVVSHNEWPRESGWWTATCFRVSFSPFAINYSDKTPFNRRVPARRIDSPRGIRRDEKREDAVRMRGIAALPLTHIVSVKRSLQWEFEGVILGVTGILFDLIRSHVWFHLNKISWVEFPLHFRHRLCLIQLLRPTSPFVWTPKKRSC